MARLLGILGDAGGTVSLALATTIVLSSIATSSGIKCYTCNSHYDRRCGDPFNNLTSELVNCDMETHKMTHLPLQKDGTPYKANICRKTVQIVADETRTIRSCGWLPNPEALKDRDCFTRTGTHQVMVYHCVCRGDACNGVALPRHQVFLLLSMALMTLAYHWAL
jgi:hypothetical protein